MASDVTICNQALIRIGAATIASLSDGTENANRCNDIYAQLRDELLRSATWNFAVKRAQLAQLGSAPAFEYDYAYQLPSDWLRTISVHGDDEGFTSPEYKIEQDEIRTDSDEIYLRYIFQVTDANLMTADFRKALSLYIAGYLAISLAGSKSMADQVFEEYRIAVTAAKGVDAIEDYPESLPEGSWVTERY